VSKPFLDLGNQPLSNAYLTQEMLLAPEVTYPLRLRFCESCYLIQSEKIVKPEQIFTENYPYFSSTSSSWMNHAKKFVEKSIAENWIAEDSFVVEIASNDGYLLKNFVDKGVKCLGIEPTKSTATVARQKGVKTIEKFFTLELAKKITSDQGKADLIIANNVYAHVPDILEFTAGLHELISSQGIIAIEFPDAQNLFKKLQFDTVYHEHYSYLTLSFVCKIMEKVGLRVFDFEEISTHGGSLRVLACHRAAKYDQSPEIGLKLTEEIHAGLRSAHSFEGFQERVNKVKNDLISFLIEAKSAHKNVIGFGAAAKANTLLNFAGIKQDLIACIADNATSKQGKFMPGSCIPIVAPVEIYQKKVDFLLIFPWNICAEINEEILANFSKKPQTLIAIPELTFL
jgi:2-polyprenyl-3-methyl-5-hydroxy-6-metoxy-1,4-benzoquinol methylase